MDYFLQTTRAPGLPIITSKLIEKYPFSDTSKLKYIPVSSYNYDYLPMNLESPKVFWVDINGQAPYDFQVGVPVKLLLNAKQGIKTLPDNSVVPQTWNSVFYVDDIVGSRIILSPYKGTKWLPTIHQPLTNPFGWGYSSETVNVSPSMHGVKYGFGAPVASIAYYPANY